jgi:putative heme-binding domain-containing protein
MRLAVVCLSCLGLMLLAGVGQSDTPPDPNIAPTGLRTPADEQKGFHLPPGFEIQLVASEPEINKPVNLAFDAHGRLWVTSTVEYPFPAPPDRPARDSVKVLEDFGEDGRARKVTTFADELNIPIGVLPLPQGAMVYSISHTMMPTVAGHTLGLLDCPSGQGPLLAASSLFPRATSNIYRLLDTDGDGKADRREVLYPRDGNLVDTHGMTGEFTWGFDGWVYACHGFSNTSTIRASDGSAITMHSGNTYRMQPDGAHVEQFTHGQVNPFGLAFDPLGNLYSCDCHTKPIMLLLRGGYYQSFGKPDDGLGFAPEIIDRYDDSTAIAGIAYYAAENFPKAYRDTAFIGDVVTHNIVQFKLHWQGSSPRAELAYFLKSDDPWFRPVSIVLGPDGALYVADFYNRIIGHYEVPLTHPGRDRVSGRIWRISYHGTEPHCPDFPPRQDWTKATIPELVKDLGDGNLTVRLRATNELVGRGPNATEAVRDLMHPGSKPVQRVHALWVLERRGALDDGQLAAASHDADRTVRVHAQRVLAERARWTSPLRELVLAGMHDPDPFVQRCAADALGRHPAPENVRPLLELRKHIPAEDAQLLHTVRMALRDQLRPDAAWQQLPLSSLSEADGRAVADVCPGVPSAPAADYLLRHIGRCAEGRGQLVRYVRHIARYGPGDVEAPLLAFIRGRKPEDAGEQVALFRALSQGAQERGRGVGKEVRAWALGLARHLLLAHDGGQLAEGIDLTSSLKLDALQDRLVMLAGTAPEKERIAALKALVAINAKTHLLLLGDVLRDAGQPAEVRDQAAGMLAGINQPEALTELAEVLPTAPARLQTAIATAMARSPAGAEKLLQTVAAGKASARLLQERPVEFVLVAASKLPNVKERVAKLTAGLPRADERIQKLLDSRRSGFVAAKPDATQGAVVFEKSCAICHTLAGKGAKIGPQLDGIGNRGLDRLLEDILDPNRNVDQAFRQTTLGLKNGQVVAGLLLREEGQVLVMADAQGKEVRVPKDTVEERTVSQLSPMPANFADQIPEKDFYNLVAYLLAQTPRR